MRKLIFVSIIALLTVAAAPADTHPEAANQAPESGSSAVPSAVGGTTVQAAVDKKTCKLLPTTGTRFSKKACLTDKEWKQVEEDLDQ